MAEMRTILALSVSIQFAIQKWDKLDHLDQSLIYKGFLVLKSWTTGPLVQLISWTTRRNRRSSPRLLSSYAVTTTAPSAHGLTRVHSVNSGNCATAGTVLPELIASTQLRPKAATVQQLARAPRVRTNGVM
jgi:hypothetical protein